MALVTERLAEQTRSAARCHARPLGRVRWGGPHPVPPLHHAQVALVEEVGQVVSDPHEEGRVVPRVVAKPPAQIARLQVRLERACLRAAVDDDHHADHHPAQVAPGAVEEDDGRDAVEGAQARCEARQPRRECKRVPTQPAERAPPGPPLSQPSRSSGAGFADFGALAFVWRQVRRVAQDVVVGRGHRIGGVRVAPAPRGIKPAELLGHATACASSGARCSPAGDGEPRLAPERLRELARRIEVGVGRGEPSVPCAMLRVRAVHVEEARDEDLQRARHHGEEDVRHPNLGEARPREQAWSEEPSKPTRR